MPCGSRRSGCASSASVRNWCGARATTTTCRSSSYSTSVTYRRTQHVLIEQVAEREILRIIADRHHGDDLLGVQIQRQRPLHRRVDLDGRTGLVGPGNKARSAADPGVRDDQGAAACRSASLRARYGTYRLSGYKAPGGWSSGSENHMRVIGLAGWSGAGKTTLLTRLNPYSSQRPARSRDQACPSRNRRRCPGQGPGSTASRALPKCLSRRPGAGP